MIAFSFNDPPGRFNFVWGEFSLGGLAEPVRAAGLEAALSTSLVVAFISTLVATILGTLIALALTRYTSAVSPAINLFSVHPDGDPGDRARREPAHAVRGDRVRAVALADRRRRCSRSASRRSSWPTSCSTSATWS